MNDKQPSKAQGEREITYRIGRKTGTIQTGQEKAEVASLRDKPLGWIAPAAKPEAAGPGAAMADALHRILWRRAPELPWGVVMALLVLLPVISFALVYYLIDILSGM